MRRQAGPGGVPLACTPREAAAQEQGGHARRRSRLTGDALVRAGSGRRRTEMEASNRPRKLCEKHRESQPGNAGDTN